MFEMFLERLEAFQKASGWRDSHICYRLNLRSDTLHKLRLQRRCSTKLVERILFEIHCWEIFNEVDEQVRQYVEKEVKPAVDEARNNLAEIKHRKNPKRKK